MKKIIPILLAALLCSGVSQAQTRKVTLQENQPLETLLKQAKKEKKLVFLDFGSPQCGPCLYMKREIFTIDSVADFVNARFVSCDYMQGSEKKRLSQLYGVYTEPVFLLLDADGNLMHRTSGKSTAGEMLRRFRIGIDPQNNLTAQAKRYDAGDREVTFIESYIDNLHIAGLDDRKVEVLKNIFTPDFDPDKLAELKFWQLYIKYDDNPVSRQSKYVVENRARFCELFGEQAVNGKLNQLFGSRARMFIFGKQAPVKNPEFADVLRYAQLCDWEGSTRWLIYLIPAQYKFTEWVNMARAVEWAYGFNIFVGAEKATYLRMMSEQLCWYCNDPEALRFAIKWIDWLLPGADEKTAESLRETRQSVVKKIAGIPSGE